MGSDSAGNLSGRNISNAKYRMIFAGLVVLAFGVFFASLAIGRYNIPFFDSVLILLAQIFPIEPTWTQTMEAVIFNLRLPRTIAAILIGGGLALSGATYQSMFKNPLVSPDLLGVSSGACVGASLAILYSMGPVVIQILAFIGGIVAVSITVAVPRLMHNSSTLMLVLSGVIGRRADVFDHWDHQVWCRCRHGSRRNGLLGNGLSFQCEDGRSLLYRSMYSCLGFCSGIVSMFSPLERTRQKPWASMFGKFAGSSLFVPRF